MLRQRQFDASVGEELRRLARSYGSHPPAQGPLDDGEAAAIAYGLDTKQHCWSTRKAVRLCAERFGHLAVGSTADLIWMYDGSARWPAEGHMTDRSTDAATAAA